MQVVRAMLFVFMSLIAGSASAQKRAAPAPELERGPAAQRTFATLGGAVFGATLAGGLCAITVLGTQDKSSSYEDTDSDSGYGPSLEISTAAWGGICYALVSPLMIAGGATLAGGALGGQGRFEVVLAGAGIGVGAPIANVTGEGRGLSVGLRVVF